MRSTSEVPMTLGETRNLLKAICEDISWDEETSELYRKVFSTQGGEFRNLNTLFGLVITTEDFVISNDPSSDTRRGATLKIPPGHPDLKAFLGMPIFFGKEMIGLAGIAHRPGGYDQSIIEALQPMLSTCAQIGAVLLKLVEDMLSLSRLQMGQLKTQDSDIECAHMLQMCVDMIASQAGAKNLKLALVVDSQIPRLVRTDRQLLTQAVVNHLANAVKFTQEGGVRVSCSFQQKTTALKSIKGVDTQTKGTLSGDEPKRHEGGAEQVAFPEIPARPAGILQTPEEEQDTDRPLLSLKEGDEVMLQTEAHAGVGLGGATLRGVLQIVQLNPPVLSKIRLLLSLLAPQLGSWHAGKRAVEVFLYSVCTSYVDVGMQFCLDFAGFFLWLHALLSRLAAIKRRGRRVFVLAAGELVILPRNPTPVNQKEQGGQENLGSDSERRQLELGVRTEGEAGVERETETRTQPVSSSSARQEMGNGREELSHS
eukprot:Cvel_30676.t1-p1 / transcript=Cvel_30676.t1 / gene=Cvel_30676 / organism=Chromera_velia_CCMP2878 / gene_product=Hybrid signal transduction histidine kinase K, putative / transcript_product=Hybrid signal transduction histidine kinase K, putative / location=Cvel_scaffold4417:5452-9804(+) / protein_length=482 / sequence_SO=supercontig / SO=protein_coding / is_pseudo=false